MGQHGKLMSPGTALKEKGIDYVRTKTTHRPELMFPKTLWTKLLTECRALGFGPELIRKLYLDHCEFSGWNRGGVVIDKLLKVKCQFEYMNLHELALRFFPTYEIVEVVECIPVAGKNNSRKLKCILAIGNQWPTEKFMIDDGFSETERQSLLKTLVPCDKIVIKHYGIRDEVREHVHFVGTTKDLGMVALANEDQKYDKLLKGSCEPATDIVQKAQEKIDKEFYAISFIKFARSMLHFCSMSYEQLVRFAASELYRKRDVHLYLNLVHKECLGLAELRFLKSLVAGRYQTDTTKDSTDIDRFMSFALRYPIMLTPLVLVQRILQRHVFGKAFAAKFAIFSEYPASFNESWTQTSREVIKNVLRDHFQAKNRQEIVGDARKKGLASNSLGKRRSSGVGQSTRRLISQSTRKLTTLQSKFLFPGNAPVANDLSKSTTRECRGCFHVTFLQPSSFCLNCEQIVKPLLARDCGYQFSEAMMKFAARFSARFAPMPTVKRRWIQEYDRKAGKVFYFDVVTGVSHWKLPEETPKREVNLLSKQRLQSYKKGNAKEWELRV